MSKRKAERLRWDKSMEEYLLSIFNEAQEIMSSRKYNNQGKMTKNKILLDLWKKKYSTISANSRQLWNKYENLKKKQKKDANINQQKSHIVEDDQEKNQMGGEITEKSDIEKNMESKVEILEKQMTNKHTQGKPQYVHFSNEKDLMKYLNVGNKLDNAPIFDNICYNCGMLLYGRISDGHKFSASEYDINNPPVRALFSDTLLDAAVYHDLLYSCRLCKSKPKSFPNCCDPSTGKQDIPAPLQNLTSFEKGKIALSGLFSSTLKKANPHKKIWEHRVGETNILSKTEELYHGMYGFLVNKTDTGNQNPSNSKIKAALQWLRLNNPLYKSFYSNMDTLFAYFESDLTIEADNNTRTTKQEEVSEQLGEEKVGICLPFQEEKSLPTISPGNDIVGIQHPVHSDEDITKTHYNDPHLEAKAWPHLFPYGIGGWHYSSSLHITDYVKMRLLNIDNRWRKDPHWSFFFFDRMIKQRLLYTAKSRKVIKDMPWEDLNVGKVKAMYSSKDSNPYSVYGSSVPITIPGSKGYWSSRLLDLLAMSREFGTPSFLVTLTQNDNWPELQQYIKNGFLDKFPTDDSGETSSPTDFPVETVVAFHKRFQSFKKNVLSNKNGPLGNVKNFWYRVEFQKRGAIHIHMVVWSSEIPHTAVVAELPRADTKSSFASKCRELVQKYQIHGQCSPERCFKGSNGQVFDKCKYGFPFSVQSDLTLDSSKMRYLYPRSHEEDSRVVPYNMEILLLWGAHINVQKLVDGGWELYCAKYVAKAEPTFDLQLQNASEPEKFLRSRICGRLEVESTLLGYPLSYSSRDVVFLPTDLSPKYGYLKRYKHLPLDNSSKDIFYDNNYEKYLDRPEELQHELYPDYFRKFRFVNSSEKPKQKTYIDAKGRVLVQRLEGKEIVPRWRYFVPYGDEQEQYFEQKLLLSVPFKRTDIKTIISSTNTSKSFMEECMIRKLFNTEMDCIDTLKTAGQRGFSLDRISEIARQLVLCGWLESGKADKFLSDLTLNRPTIEQSVEVPDTDLIGEESYLGDLKPNETVVDLNSLTSKFSESQAKAYEFLTQSISKSQTLACVVGSAGTGKSFLINAIVAELKLNSKMTVQKLATTGVAAFLIGGTTVHNFFKMDIECHSYLEKGTPEYYIAKDTDVIIIDEFSLIDKKVFLCIDSLCRCLSGGMKMKEPFGGKHIIMVGDPAQLPAIDGDIFCTLLWRKFHILMLEESQRQKDSEFLKILNEVRLGNLSDESNEALQTRIISDISEVSSDAPVIVSLRKDRDEWNNHFLNQLDGEVYEFPAKDTDGNGNEISLIEKQKIVQYHRERLPDCLTIKVGAKVMLLKNINVKEGWINGTLATVFSVNDDYIFIKNVTNGKKLVVSRIKQNLAFRSSTSGVIRQQFPLALGWALTVHKVQGMTLSKAYIKFDETFFASGQAYVALSRVKSLENIHFINYSTSAILLDPFFDNLLKWMKSVNVISRTKQSEHPYPCRKTKLTDNEETQVDNAVDQSLESKVDESSTTAINAKRPKLCNSTNDVGPSLLQTLSRKTVQQKKNLSLSPQKHVNLVKFPSDLQNYLHPTLRQFYSIQRTPPDGNCLFHSISIALNGNCLLSTNLRSLAVKTLLDFQNFFKRQIEREPLQSFDEIISLALTDRAWCNEYHLQALAIALKRPIFVYTQFCRSPGDFFFPTHSIEQLQLAFRSALPGTRQHLVYWPMENVDRSNSPLMCFFSNQHYSAIVPNGQQTPHLIPNQCLFQMDSVEE